MGVTSIKDLFYRTFGDITRAIAEIGHAGYQAIEVFDGNLVQYDGKLGELRTPLGDAGLSLLAVYSGGNFIFPEILGEELWRIRKAADLAAELGAEHLVVGGGANDLFPQRTRTIPDWRPRSIRSPISPPNAACSRITTRI